MLKLMVLVVAALAAVAVPTRAYAVPARAYANPTTPCISLSHPHVVGGNNLIYGNPGNPAGKDWIRSEGVQATFVVPLNPTVNTNCVGPTAGIWLKLRLVDATDQLTDTSVVMGVSWDNDINEDGVFTVRPTWGVGYGTDAEGTAWDSVVLDGNPIIGVCQLNLGGTVSLRIYNHTGGGWGTECWDPIHAAWVNMDVGSNGYITNSTYVDGVSLLSRWRAGSTGGLNLTASSLQWKDLSGDWTAWQNSDCFSNTSPDYYFNGAPTNSFSISAGTPNPSC